MTLRHRAATYRKTSLLVVAAAALVAWRLEAQQPYGAASIGREVAVGRHMQDDEEFTRPIAELIEYGKLLFGANWTGQEGGGRPLTKGTGKALTNQKQPLTGPREFNRISGPDANSCAGCHNAPHGIVGGGGDYVTNVFVLAQRFDFVTFDPRDTKTTGGALDETNQPVSLQTVGNSRATPGMFGAGYLEMVARQMTDDLQKIRDTIQPGQSKPLVSKGIPFGTLTRRVDGTWDSQAVEGLARLSLLAPTPIDRPSLIVRPWHQAANVVSLREFTNTSYNHHHGIQTTERFGVNTDPDGDGVMNEMTRADVTAVAMFQATLAVPGRVIPNNLDVERAVLTGERVFSEVGCATCHVPELPLEKSGWLYSEPSPYNPSTNLRRGDARVLSVDLSHPGLPLPRLAPSHDDPAVIRVPAYTDLKLHDIGNPGDALAREPLDMNQTVWSPKFKAGNQRFLTKRLWGAANEPPYFHHGLFTTMRQAVLAHSGEALESRRAFQRRTKYEQDSMIEFLKTLQVLPPGTKDPIVDERYQPKTWPPSPRMLTSTSPK